VKAAQAQHHSDYDTKIDELAIVQADLTKTQASIDRYLEAFEVGELDADQVAEQVNKLNDRHKKLRWRRDELRVELDNQPMTPTDPHWTTSRATSTTSSAQATTTNARPLARRS
jgi:predicted nuclease with TOPRIM domain